MQQKQSDPFGTVTAKLDMFWLTLAAGHDEEVGERLARAGYSNVFDAMRDLLDDVLITAQDLRERGEVEAAVQMEKLADEIASYLSPH
ncbi:MAG: hypothetical protein C0491_06255 [Novosphingobium sp.]|nr:hypothetical protein [Novosphingobium sp.]